MTLAPIFIPVSNNSGSGDDVSALGVVVILLALAIIAWLICTIAVWVSSYDGMEQPKTLRTVLKSQWRFVRRLRF